MNIFNFTFIITALLSLLSCSESTDNIFDTVYYKPKYAKGFEIVGTKNSKSRVIRILSPWQGADSVAIEVFITAPGENAPNGFKGPILKKPAKKLALMSSTYIAMLELLNKEDLITAVSGLDFVNNHIVSKSSRIVDVGNIENLDYEKLYATSPDMTLLYGISSASTAQTKLSSLNLPFMYMGEYLEKDPLGRAEWLVVMGQLIGETKSAILKFEEIERRYNQLKEAAQVDNVLDRPLVMLNYPYGDSWFMPAKNSAIANIIYDAGGFYMYPDGENSNKTTPIDLEMAYSLVQKADYWLDLGSISTLEALNKSLPNFMDAKCIKEGKVYNPDKIINDKGGNDYWERGMVRPDLILEDLIKIFKQENDSLTFYRKL